MTHPPFGWTPRPLPTPSSCPPRPILLQQVNVIGGGQYAEHTSLNALGRLPADPTSDEVEAEIAAVPSPTLHRLRSVPAEEAWQARPASPTVRSVGEVTSVQAARGALPLQQPGISIDGGAAPRVVGGGARMPHPGAPSKTGSCADVAPLHRACGGPYSALSAAVLRGIDSPSVREGVERAMAAARREGLSEVLMRLKRAVVEDDANDEHRAALDRMGGAGVGSAAMGGGVELDSEETAGDAASQAPFTPRAERSGAAVPRSRVGPGEFSPD